LTTAKPLMENAGVCYLCTKKGGNFDVPGWLAHSWMAMPNPHGKPNSEVLRPWVNGTDIVKERHGKWIVDFGTSITENDAALYDRPFAHVLEHVKPEREKNNREIRRLYWWRFSETLPALRKAIASLSRYIVSPRVSKYRIFSWRNGIVMPDDGVVAIASDSNTTFGILHSRFHELWSLRLCTWMGQGNDPRCTPTTCFETFPFPAGLTPREMADMETCAYDDQSANVAKAIAEVAINLNQHHENWLNPPEWVDWVITTEEEKTGFPKRPVAKPGHEADLKKSAP
jgi:type II restriction/modification system DNA methylase subunit YeeA